MKVICGIGLDSDVAFVSFAGITKNKIELIAEQKIRLDRVCSVLRADEYVEILLSLTESIISLIAVQEKKYNTKVKEVCFSLPYGVCRGDYASKSLIFKTSKRVSSNDIRVLQKNLENELLNWDESVVSHFTHSYDFDSEHYDSLPLGKWAKKITIHSGVYAVKTDFYEKIEDFSLKLNCRLGAIVPAEYAQIASFYPHGCQVKSAIVIYVGYDSANFTFIDGNRIKSTGQTSIGLRMVIEKIANEFRLTYDIAREVFSVYVNFDAGAGELMKTISVKNGDYFVTVNMSLVNSFVRGLFESMIKDMFADNLIGKFSAEELEVAIMGRFFEKSTVLNFFKETFRDFRVSPFENISLAFGAVLFKIYSLSIPQNRYKMMWRRMVNIYNEYF